MFSDQDLQLFEVWAKNKIAKVKHEAAEIAIGFDDDNTKHSKIMNINV